MRRQRPHENLSVIFLTLGGRGPSDRSEWRWSGTVAACPLTSACSRRRAGPAAADTARLAGKFCVPENGWFLKAAHRGEKPGPRGEAFTPPHYYFAPFGP